MPEEVTAETPKNKQQPPPEEPKVLTLYDCFNKHSLSVQDSRINQKIIEEGLARLALNAKINKSMCGDALVSEYILMAVLPWSPAGAMASVMTTEDMDIHYRLTTKAYKKWKEIVAETKVKPSVSLRLQGTLFINRTF